MDHRRHTRQPRRKRLVSTVGVPVTRPPRADPDVQFSRLRFCGWTRYRGAKPSLPAHTLRRGTAVRRGRGDTAPTGRGAACRPAACAMETSRRSPQAQSRAARGRSRARPRRWSGPVIAPADAGRRPAPAEAGGVGALPCTGGTRRGAAGGRDAACRGARRAALVSSTPRIPDRGSAASGAGATGRWPVARLGGRPRKHRAASSGTRQAHPPSSASRHRRASPRQRGCTTFAHPRARASCREPWARTGETVPPGGVPGAGGLPGPSVSHSPAGSPGRRRGRKARASRRTRHLAQSPVGALDVRFISSRPVMQGSVCKA